MIGHCGGLRDTQRIGDYVLAHAYLRDDHVLDEVLPPEIPIPPSPKCRSRCPRGRDGFGRHRRQPLKKRMRTGTVATTDDRNWELQYTVGRRLAQPCGGIDMESATIAAQGYRFRVPTGTCAVRLGQTAPRRNQDARPGQPLLRGSHRRAHLQIGTHHPRPVARRRLTPPQPQAARLQRAAVPLRQYAA